MKDEISRVLTLLEEGKLDKEQASELIGALQDNGQQDLVSMKTGNTYEKKILKIQVISVDGDNVNVNLPVNLIKVLLKVGPNVAEKIPEAEKYVKYLKDVDFDLLIGAIENEFEGKLVDIISASGDSVYIAIE